jgi:hypothetical protein
MKNRKILFALLILSSWQFAISQDVPIQYNPQLHGDGYGIIRGDVVQIQFGNEVEQVPFLMSFDQKNWTRFVLKKDRHIDIYLKKRRRAVLEICTPGKNCKRYYVDGANAYRIFWNKDELLWVLRKE